MRPHPPGFGNGVSQCDAGGPVNHRLQLPETEKPPVSGRVEDYAECLVKKKKLSYICVCVQVESSSFTAMATARSGPGGSSIGSRGYGGTGVFLPRAVSDVLTQCLFIIL